MKGDSLCLIAVLTPSLWPSKTTGEWLQTWFPSSEFITWLKAFFLLWCCLQPLFSLMWLYHEVEKSSVLTGTQTYRLSITGLQKSRLHMAKIYKWKASVACFLSSNSVHLCVSTHRIHLKRCQIKITQSTEAIAKGRKGSICFSFWLWIMQNFPVFFTL